MSQNVAFPDQFFDLFLLFWKTCSWIPELGVRLKKDVAAISSWRGSEIRVATPQRWAPSSTDGNFVSIKLVMKRAEGKTVGEWLVNGCTVRVNSAFPKAGSWAHAKHWVGWRCKRPKICGQSRVPFLGSGFERFKFLRDVNQGSSQNIKPALPLYFLVRWLTAIISPRMAPQYRGQWQDSSTLVMGSDYSIGPLVATDHPDNHRRNPHAMSSPLISCSACPGGIQWLSARRGAKVCCASVGSGNRCRRIHWRRNWPILIILIGRWNPPQHYGTSCVGNISIYIHI